ncbi:MAG TPA: hypothetical protein VH915_12255 [Pedococcus sp.]
MGWFRRKGAGDQGDDGGRDAGAGAPGAMEPVAEVPERAVVEPVSAEDRQRIEVALAELAAAGVDVDDLDSIGAGLDAAFAAWEAQPEPREGHDTVIARFALGLGEHLHRHTDLRWGIVTDAFGTDLGVAGTGRGDFVVVPGNLIAVRWLRRETGWVPGVVGHIVRMRSR